MQLGLLKTPLITQTWELPGAAINVAENQFLVQFEGSLLGPNLSLGSIIDRSRSVTNLTANNGVLDLAGIYTNTIVRPDQTVSEVRTVGAVNLINSIVGDGAAPVLKVDHRLELRAGSQLGTDEIRIGGSGELAVTQGQIARDGANVPGGNAKMDIHLGGIIRVNAITNGFDGFGNLVVERGGSLLIDSANVLPDFDGVGQGLIEVRGPAGLGTGANTLRLSNIGTFQSALDVGDHGLVFIDPSLATPTRFTGERVFQLAGTNGASVRNLNVINIASGPVSIESGLLQTQGNPADIGFLSVKSTLELRSNLSGGFVGLLPGALLKLYDNGALDSGVRLEGSQARIAVLGDSRINGRVILDRGGLLPALTTDHAAFNELGQPGVSETPHLQLDAASVLIRQGSLLNASGARISALPQTSIVLEVGPNLGTGYGTVYGPVGSIENYGSFEFTGANAITRHQTNATNVLPALTNAEGATLAVNAGQTRISGGLLNAGDISIGSALGENAELRLGNLAGSSNGAANHDFVQFAGSTVVHETGRLVLQPDASLIINGGRVDFFGARLEGRIINNGGILTIDTANPQNPLQAALLGDYTQMAGELVIGAHQLFSGFHITGTATLGGILDLTAFQSGVDGLVSGYDFTIQHGEQFEALSFGASLSRFGAYRLPEVDSFYWVPVYSDTALAFRLQDPLLTPLNITSIVQGFQSQIGVVPNVPQTVNAANAQLELAAQLQIGNAFRGAGILNIDDAVLNTNGQGIAIERTGQLNATNNSVIAAFGNISVNGGSLQLLQNSRIAPSANGIALVAMNGAAIRHEGGGYELPADGSLRVESGASVFINGSLDFANNRGALLRVIGPGSTLTAAPNGELSEWFVPVSPQGDFHGEVELSNGGVLNIGSLAATAISDEFTIVVTGAGSRLQQTLDASLDLGRGTNRRGDVFGGVTMTIANGGEVLTGSGGIDIGYLGVLNLLGGTFSANSDVDVVGGQINGSALALDLNGHDLTASDKATLNFITALELSGGSTLELIGNARLNALSIDINSAAGGGGSLVAAGMLTFIDTDPGLVSHWGNGANTAQVTLLDGVTANFGSIELAGPGASLRVGSGILVAPGRLLLSQVTMENLAAGTSGLDNNVFVGLNDGAAIVVNGAVTLGGADQGATVLEIDGGILRTQVIDINRAGQLSLQAGAVNLQSLLSVDGAFAHADGTVIGDAANLILGTDSSSAGVYTLGGDRAMLSMSNEYIGDHGMGTFTHDNGSNSVSSFLIVGANSGSNGAYLFNGGNLLAGNAYIGDRGTGAFTHRGGVNSLISNLVLGANTGSNGVYALSGTGQVFASHESIGDRGTGAFAQSDGGVNMVSGALVVGAQAGSTGSYALSGGPATELNAGDEFIGDHGTGTFSHSGGVNRVASTLVLGANTGSHGAYTLSGSGVVRASNEIIGGNGIGTFIQTAGGNAVSDTLYIGGSNGSYDLSGTGGLSAREVVIGAHGFGNFYQHGGDHRIASTLYVGGSDGRYTLGGGTLSVANIVRLPGASTFNLVGGKLNVTGILIDVETFNVGSVANAGGNFTLGNTQTLTADLLTVSSPGSDLVAGSVASPDGGVISAGSLAIMNGGHVTSRGGWVGSNVASVNSVSVVASAQVSGADSLWQTRFLNIGYLGDGSVEVANGGAVTTTKNLILGGTVGQSGELEIGAGGRVDTGDNAFVGRADTSVGRVVLAGAGATWNIGDSLYLGGDDLAAGGTASLTIGEGATVNVTNAVKFWQGGSLFLQGGVLQAATIDAGTSGVTLTGGTFAVDKFTGDLINHGATLSPGNSPGITDIIGNYSQDVNSTLLIEIGGLEPGAGGYDALHVTGLVELAGALTVELYDSGQESFVPTLGNSFDIVVADAISGEFDIFAFALLGGGLGWELHHLVNAFGNTDVLRLEVVAAVVPLPPALWLFASTLIGLMIRVQRSRVGNSEREIIHPFRRRRALPR